MAATFPIWVGPEDPLPLAQHAPGDAPLAVGIDISPYRLEEAYSKGLFPWFSEGDPVLWWSPSPRMVLACEEVIISKSLAKLLRQIKRLEGSENAVWKISINQAFERVISECAASVPGRKQTWIAPIIQQIYNQWHVMGRVHSIEVWYRGELAGGLYGVAMGHFFFGESMFHRIPNASKIALVYLTRWLRKNHIQHIDCQQATPHLHSMGAQAISRNDFLILLKQALEKDLLLQDKGYLLQSGEVLPFNN